MLNIDLNCDIGESTSLWPYSIQHDLSLLPYFTSINIACGFHAGDPDTAVQLIRAAIPLNIAIGAHPSFPDRENFGRKEMNIEEKDLFRIIYQQIEFLASLSIRNGARMQHVKLHGALYNMAARDQRMAQVICSAIQSYDADLLVYGLSGSRFIEVADAIGLRAYREVFADRCYEDDGTLVSRGAPDAVIQDETKAVEQVLQMVTQGCVKSRAGTLVPLNAETICIHSDGNHSLEFAKKIHAALKKQGINIIHP